jgi:hypothetical protein
LGRLVKEEWSSQFTVAVEDYLHGLISVVNELVRSSCESLVLFAHSPSQSRVAVNAVTMGDYEEPLKISVYVKDVFAGFSMVSFVSLFRREAV